MAAPLPFAPEPPAQPAGHGTSILAILTDPAVFGFDYFVSTTSVQTTRLRVYNTIGIPWWTEDALPPLASFSNAFDTAFEGGV